MVSHVCLSELERNRVHNAVHNDLMPLPAIAARPKRNSKWALKNHGEWQSCPPLERTHFHPKPEDTYGSGAEYGIESFPLVSPPSPLASSHGRATPTGARSRGGRQKEGQAGRLWGRSSAQRKAAAAARDTGKNEEGRADGRENEKGETQGRQAESTGFAVRFGLTPRCELADVHGTVHINPHRS